MTVTFSEVTNRAGFTDLLTRADVDSLFTFGIYSLGQGYIGEWKDDQTLLITITDPFGATPVEVGFVVAQVRLQLRRSFYFPLFCNLVFAAIFN